MKERKSILVCVVLATALLAPAACPKAVAEIISDSGLKALGLQRYWQTSLPLVGGDAPSRAMLLDDSLYVLTESNIAYALHAPTGILRWAKPVAEEGQFVRGPTHSGRFAFFTPPGSIRLLDRQTGEPAREPRSLRGVVIEAAHDTATISIGGAHGVRAGNVLQVLRADSPGGSQLRPIAQLKITSLDERQAKGRLTRLSSSLRTASGDPVRADVELPRAEVKLPFAASCAAVADDKSIYVGAANQRFYCLDIESGLQHWQFLTPHTVSATPVLKDGTLYVGGQDGRVVSVSATDRRLNWSFETEGPIFTDLVVDARHVFVAASDRSLYCLDRATGRRIWRERFDTPLSSPPVLSSGRLYQQVPQQGMFVLDAESGKHLWRRDEGNRFLVELDESSCLVFDQAAASLLLVDPRDGKVRASASVSDVSFAAASQEDEAVVLGGRDGDVLCLRSAKAARMTPERLAQALRDEGKIRAARSTELTAAPVVVAKGPELPPLPDRLQRLFEEDWLVSRSGLRPVGGHGLVELETAAPATATAAAEEEGEEAGEAAEEEEAEAEEGEDEGAEEAEAAEAEEEGEEVSDEEADDEEVSGEEGEAEASEDEEAVEDEGTSGGDYDDDEEGYEEDDSE